MENSVEYADIQVLVRLLALGTTASATSDARAASKEGCVAKKMVGLLSPAQEATPLPEPVEEIPVPQEEPTKPDAVWGGYRFDLESAPLCFSPKERFSHSLLRHFVGKTRTGETTSQKSPRFPASKAAHA